MPAYNELVGTRNFLAGLKERDEVKTSEMLAMCNSVVSEATNKRIGGEFLVVDGSAPIGQDILSALMNECITIYYDIEGKYLINID